jgi:hypothetical protein
MLFVPLSAPSFIITTSLYITTTSEKKNYVENTLKNFLNEAKKMKIS